MQHINLNIKTGKTEYINLANQIPKDLLLNAQKVKEDKINIANLKSSTKIKLINLGFTENECKHIIH